MNAEKNEGAERAEVMPSRPTVRNIAVGLSIGAIRFYQRGISPLLGPKCRFVPTCSQYAIEAIEKRGILLGSWQAVRRILRCHPWNPGGYDPPA